MSTGCHCWHCRYRLPALEAYADELERAIGDLLLHRADDERFDEVSRRALRIIESWPPTGVVRVSAQ